MINGTFIFKDRCPPRPLPAPADEDENSEEDEEIEIVDVLFLAVIFLFLLKILTSFYIPEKLNSFLQYQ